MQHLCNTYVKWGKHNRTERKQRCKACAKRVHLQQKNETNLHFFTFVYILYIFSIFHTFSKNSCFWTPKKSKWERKTTKKRVQKMHKIHEIFCRQKLQKLQNPTKCSQELKNRNSVSPAILIILGGVPIARLGV